MLAFGAGDSGSNPLGATYNNSVEGLWDFAESASTAGGGFVPASGVLSQGRGAAF